MIRDIGLHFFASRWDDNSGIELFWEGFGSAGIFLCIHICLISACSLYTRTIGQSNSRETAHLAVERVAPAGVAHRLVTAARRMETGQRELSTSHVSCQCCLSCEAW